jgi:hypothetical protein
MRSRKVALVGLLMAALAVLVWCSPGKPTGPVFRDRTAAQWEAELQHWDAWDMGIWGYGREPSPHFVWMRTPPWWQGWLQKVGIEVHSGSGELPLLEGDPDALPVLVELLHSADPKGRRAAIQGLTALGAAAKEVIPDLVRALDDPDHDVRVDARQALKAVDADTAQREQGKHKCREPGVP